MEIRRIPLVFHNDPFLHARKRLGIVADLTKKQKGYERTEREKVESLTDTMEKKIEEERGEEVEEREEVGEEQEAPEIRKSKRISMNKAKVVHPKGSKKERDLPRLDDVSRKKRKLLEVLTVGASKAKLCFFIEFLFSFLLLSFKFHYTFSFVFLVWT